MDKVFHVSAFGKSAPTDPVPAQLRHGHLWLSAELAAEALGDEWQVYVVYYPRRGDLLLAPMSDTAFKSLHDCGLVMLKVRNARGDKSLSLQEILIDNELDTEDRQLEYSTLSGASVLRVRLGEPTETPDG